MRNNPVKAITVALDVMGADVSPESIMAGGFEAARELGKRLRLVFVGKREVISDFTDAHRELPENIDIEEAAYAVAMSETPTEGIRKKKSSIAVGLAMQKEGRADAFVSAGNTGAVMASSVMTLGKIEGVSRPAIAALFPTVHGQPTLALDVGANVDCKPFQLYQFGIMGSIYASLMTGRTSPRVGLLSIGEEKSKGNEQIVQTWDLFKKSALNFIGNVEGRDILTGRADVVVADGFVGNALLKFAESVEGFLTTKIRHQVQTNIFSRVGAALMKPFLRRLRMTFDYSEYGGAPLLGIGGVCIVCHGTSSPKAIKNAVITAAEMVRHRIGDNIREEMATNDNGIKNGQENKRENRGSGVIRPIPTSNQL
ncbi:MAG: phosphate acyltransferase PlsX [Candidatus Zixiibacteriota bacterium]|nr:MAG: phosphate acyltransferase PlsX [candidate division Zixibacteria bacterium]